MENLFDYGSLRNKTCYLITRKDWAKRFQALQIRNYWARLLNGTEILGSKNQITQLVICLTVGPIESL
jgi:hypothetical protein